MADTQRTKAAPTVAVYDMAGTVNKVTMNVNGLTGTVANVGDSGFKVNGL